MSPGQLMKESKSKDSSIVKSMPLIAGERPFACRLVVGCVGSGRALDEAEDADGLLVANGSC